MVIYHKRILSFKYALTGIYQALKEEPNLKFHLFAGLLALIAGLVFQITTAEWIVLFLLIGLVISVELTNTAIEAVVDSFTDQQHPAAKKAKDISAGAVLIVAITALAIGVLIFLPHLWIFFP